MLSLYRSPEGSGNSSDEERVIPAGTPYLTKVNGELVMARHKRSTRIRAMSIKDIDGTTAKTLDLTRPLDAAVDFLGEAFGVRGRTQRNRAKSYDRPSLQTPNYAGFPYNYQQSSTCSAPLLQRAFSTMSNFPTTPVLQQPIQYGATQPLAAIPDFDQLRRIDAHYRSIHGENLLKATSATVKTEGLDSKSTNPVARHTCANCGKIRSRRYYAEHPIKPGEIPIQEFCRKCQRDASSTSSPSSSTSSRSSDNRSGSKHSKSRKKRSNAQLRNKRKVKGVSSKDDISESSEPAKQHHIQSEKKRVNGEPIRDRSEKQQSEYRLHSKRHVKKHDLNDDAILSLDESSGIGFQSQGRARDRVEKPKFSRRNSSPRPETSRPSARHKHHEISLEPQSRRRQEVRPNREPYVPVYQYVQVNKSRSHPDKKQRNYERRSPIDPESRKSYNHRPSSSQRSRIWDISSDAPTLSSKKNSFESISSLSKESVQHQRYGRENLGEEMSSYSRKPNVSRPWSRDEPRSMTRPGLYETHKLSNTREASSLYDDTSESNIEQRSRTHGHPGVNYTHYHGDWTIRELSPTLRDHHQWKECSKQQQGYRRSHYQDLDLSSLEDGGSDVTTSILASNNLPPAPAPPSFGNRVLPEELRSHVDYEGGSHDSSRNEKRSQYQEAFARESKASMPTPTVFSGASMKPDPFYAAINTIIDGDIDDKENAAKGGAIKHVTFRSTESIDGQVNSAHTHRRWSNTGSNRWA